MSDTEKKEQETSKVEEAQNIQVENPKDERLEALENITNKQAELINKLLKQTEITNKVNEQLTRNFREKAEDSKPTDPYAWVEDKIKNFQDFGCTSLDNFQRAKGTNGGLTKKGLEFYVKFLKEREKLSSQEVAQRIGNTMVRIDAY